MAAPPPTQKSLYLKKSPYWPTYIEKSSLFLKQGSVLQKAMLKNVLPDCLGTAWKSKKAKKVEKHPNLTKRSQIKKCQGEEVYILTKDVNTNIRNQSQIGLKKAYFWVHPNLGS